MANMLRTCIVLSLLLISAVREYGFAQTPDAITPASISATLSPGQCSTQVITLTTGPSPVPRLDVALLFDITSSMLDEIDQVRRSAGRIVTHIRRLVPDTNFAVGTFSDYPYVERFGNPADPLANIIEFGGADDFPWRVDQDFTADTGRVQTALDAITLRDGGDGPESYLRALAEAENLAWRPEARRIIFLFGDSIPHEPDPGPDNQLDSDDDLTTPAVIQRLQEHGISVMAVYSPGIPTDFYQQVAAQTGGDAYSLPNAGQAPDAIAALIEQDVHRLRQVTLRPTADYASWMNWSPSTFDVVEGDQTVSFDTTICRPAETPGDTHRFEISVMALGSPIYTVPVTIYPVGGLPAWWPFLLIPLVLLALATLVWLLRKRATPKPPRTPPGAPPRAGPRPSPARPSQLPTRPRPGGKDVYHG